MVAHALVAPLQGVALFQDLDSSQIGSIARTAERVMFKPGQPIVRRDEMADAAYLIVAGQAVRTQGPELGEASAIVETGSLIGEMAMIVETEHSATVVATTPVRALRISREAMLAHMTDDPTLADRLMDRIVERLMRLADDLRAVEGSFSDDAMGDAAELAPTRH